MGTASPHCLIKRRGGLCQQTAPQQTLVRTAYINMLTGPCSTGCWVSASLHLQLREALLAHTLTPIYSQPCCSVLFETLLLCVCVHRR
jgi:hypothetical protein